MKASLKKTSRLLATVVRHARPHLTWQNALLTALAALWIALTTIAILGARRQWKDRIKWVCDGSAPHTPWQEFHDAENRNASVYTPYHLTPGGGEKYLLSVVEVLQKSGHFVTLFLQENNIVQSVDQIMATASHLRVELDPAMLAIATWPMEEDDWDVARANPPRVFFALGNEKYPQAEGFGQLNFYMCQFPFDLDQPGSKGDIQRLATYNYVLLNSQFTFKWYSNFVQQAMPQLTHMGWSMPSIEVVYPPVTLLPPAPSTAAVRTNIMLLGRFFKDERMSKGHMTALLMFRDMLPQLPNTTRLVLAGQQVTGFGKFVQSLRDFATKHKLDHRVVFLVSQPFSVILDALHTSAVQWHLTGIEFDGAKDPATLEHFGISIVEGMSAGALPVALELGGPGDIIEHGVCGYLARDADEVMKYTHRLLRLPAVDRVVWSDRAVARAQNFGMSSFRTRVT
ncbi:hypothetical protein FOA52_009827 [Chlamydomonas sp. UWO 241]|nr:hypothetical protein FOA52_009827 [Chlamydomonas sp. UWO 241]